MAKEVFGTGSNRSVVELPEPTKRVSEHHANRADSEAPEKQKPFVEKQYPSHDTDK